MSTEPVTVPQPRHPLHALTTYELVRFRRELEHALMVLPQHAAVRELLQGKLAEVLAEQHSRTKIAATVR
jgi:hypothetical protein